MDTDDAGAPAAHAKPAFAVANGRTPEEGSAADKATLAGPEGAAPLATPGNGAATSPAPASGADPTDSAAAAAAATAAQLVGARRQPQLRQRILFSPPAPGVAAPAGVRPGAGLALGAGSPGAAAAAAAFGVRHAPFGVPLAPNSAPTSPSAAVPFAGSASKLSAAPATTAVGRPAPQPPEIPAPAAVMHASALAAPGHHSPQPPPPGPCAPLPHVSPAGRKRPRVEGEDTDASGAPALPSAVEAEQKQLVSKLNFELKQAKQRIERQASALELTKAEFDKQVKAQQERFNVHLSQEKAILEKNLQYVKDMLLEARLKYAGEIHKLAAEHKGETERFYQRMVQLKKVRLSLETENRNAQLKTKQVEMAVEDWKAKSEEQSKLVNQLKAEVHQLQYKIQQTEYFVQLRHDVLDQNIGGVVAGASDGTGNGGAAKSIYPPNSEELHSPTSNRTTQLVSDAPMTAPAGPAEAPASETTGAAEASASEMTCAAEELASEKNDTAEASASETTGAAVALASETTGAAEASASETIGAALALAPETTGAVEASTSETTGAAEASTSETTGAAEASASETTGVAVALASETTGVAEASTSETTGAAESSPSEELRPQNGDRIMQPASAAPLEIKLPPEEPADASASETSAAMDVEMHPPGLPSQLPVPPLGAPAGATAHETRPAQLPLPHAYAASPAKSDGYPATSKLESQQAVIQKQSRQLQSQHQKLLAAQQQVAGLQQQIQEQQQELATKELLIRSLQQELQLVNARAQTMLNQATSAQDAAKKWVDLFTAEDPSLSTPESVMQILRGYKAQLEVVRAPNAQVRQLETEHQRLQNESRTWAATLKQIDPALKSSQDLLKKVAELKGQSAGNNVQIQKEQELSATVAERAAALEHVQKVLAEKEKLLSEKQAYVEKLEAERQQTAQANQVHTTRFRSALDRANARVAAAEKERDAAKKESDSLRGKADTTPLADISKRLELAEKTKANLLRQLDLMREQLEAKAAGGDQAKGPDLITQKLNKELRERARMLDEELDRVVSGTKVKEQDEQIKKLTVELGMAKADVMSMQAEKEKLEKRVSELEKVQQAAGSVGPTPLRFLGMGQEPGFPKRQ